MLLRVGLHGGGASDVRSGAWCLQNGGPCRGDDVRIFVRSQALKSVSDRGQGGPAFPHLRDRHAWSVGVYAPGVVGIPRQIQRRQACQHGVCRSYRRGVTVKGMRIGLPFCSPQSCWSVSAKMCNAVLPTHLG